MVKKLIITGSVLLAGTSVCRASLNDSASFYYAKAQQQQMERRYQDAEMSYLKAVFFEPQSSEIYTSLGKYYLEIRKYSEALPVYERLYKLDPTNADVLNQLATLSFNLKKYEAAATYFNKLKDMPGFTDTSAVKMGHAYMQIEDYGKAIAAFETALSKNTQNAEAAYNLGRCYVELSNYKTAIVYYQQAIRLQPAKYMWSYELGLLLFSNQDYNGAISQFEKSLAAGMPRNNTYLENLGTAQLYTDDYEKGMATLNELLLKKPNDLDVLTQIADAWYRNAKYQKAIDTWQRLRDIDSTNYKALYNQGMAYQKMGKTEKGKYICDEAISKDHSLEKLRMEKMQF